MSASATETFVQETLDGLEELEDKLLALETDSSPDLIDDIFRTMHTIKGSGAMFGFDPLAEFTHDFETAFELVREGRIGLSKELVDLSLSARDHMLSLLNANDDREAIGKLNATSEAQDLRSRILALIAGGTGASATNDVAENAAEPNTGPVPAREVVIRFRPHQNALRNGMRPDFLVRELAELGTTEVAVDPSDVPTLEDLDPFDSHLSWTIKLVSEAPLDDIEEVFLFASDEAEIDIREISPKGADTIQTSSAAGQKDTGGEKAPEGAQKSSAVRIPSQRLDALMDQLGELVIAQTRLNQLSHEINRTSLTSVAEEVERLVNGLRDATLAMRMIPIEVVFGKFRRVVRSLSDELGKSVELITQGGETELDKNVIDSLSEPLVHMIRNAIDHGLETPEERVKVGKREQGSVYLSARQSGGEVLISVSDDGKGLNTEAIRARAIERGLITAEDHPSDEDLHRLIFEPAFSTATKVSSVSGRGVGMDAVRRVVSNLRGSIDIDTFPGKGSRITLRLPVTLAIIDGLLVRVGDGIFVVPLSSVSECVELAEAERRRDSGRTLLQIREELVPFLNLDDLFGFCTGNSGTRRVVIVESEGRRIGLVVDDTLGQHQTVIKTFTPFHRNIDGFAGSTILGDGSVALILDVPALIKRALQNAQVAAA